MAKARKFKANDSPRRKAGGFKGKHVGAPRTSPKPKAKPAASPKRKVKGIMTFTSAGGRNKVHDRKPVKQNNRPLTSTKKKKTKPNKVGRGGVIGAIHTRRKR